MPPPHRPTLRSPECVLLPEGRLDKPVRTDVLHPRRTHHPRSAPTPAPRPRPRSPGPAPDGQGTDPAPARTTPTPTSTTTTTTHPTTRRPPILSPPSATPIEAGLPAHRSTRRTIRIQARAGPGGIPPSGASRHRRGPHHAGALTTSQSRARTRHRRHPPPHHRHAGISRSPRPERDSGTTPSLRLRVRDEERMERVSGRLSGSGS